MIQINSRETDYDCRWFKVIKKNVTLNSKTGDYYSVSLYDYITCFVLTEDRKVILVKQYRHAIEDFSIEFPSGLLDTSETPEECAIKEVWEETGLKVQKIYSLGSYYSDVGRLSNRIHYFFAKTDSSLNAKSQEEEITLEILTPEELNEKIGRGEFLFSMQIALITLLNNKMKEWMSL